MGRAKGLIGTVVTMLFMSLGVSTWGENTLYGTLAVDSLDTGDYNAFFGQVAGGSTLTGPANTTVEKLLHRMAGVGIAAQTIALR